MIVDKARKKYAKRLKKQDFGNVMLAKTYHSIHTCSIFRWWKIIETGDLTWLLKEKREVNAKEGRALEFLYKCMQKEYKEQIPKSDEQISYESAQAELFDCLMTRMIDQDDTQFTFIEIAKDKLQKFIDNSSTEKPNLYTLKISLEKILGIKINVQECTVAEFYGYIDFANKQHNE